MNKQETFWAGSDGDEYQDRNQVRWQERIPFWRGIIEKTQPAFVLDVGCAGGWNQRAMKVVDPHLLTTGVDINEHALSQAIDAGVPVFHCRAKDLVKTYGARSADLVCTSGVLIHVAPDDLEATMRAIVEVSRRWVIAVEYASLSGNEEPIQYRFEEDLLWKRPYGLLYKTLGMKLIECGDAQGFHNCSYWLLEKEQK